MTSIKLSACEIDIILIALSRLAEDDRYEESANELIDQMSNEASKELEEYYERRAREERMEHYNRCMESGSHMA